MGCSLLATSCNMLATFGIFRDVLCGTLKQGVLGNALCKDSRSVRLFSFRLFISLSVISGFYAVLFSFFYDISLFVLSFHTFAPSFLLILRICFSLLNTFHPMFSSSCSACSHAVEESSIKVQEYFGSLYSCGFFSLQPNIRSELSYHDKRMTG